MESKTLSYSEQKGLNCLFKLAQSGLLPSEAWDAVDWGRVENVGHDQGFGGEWQLKERRIIVEWKKAKVAVKLVLRGEIPIYHGQEITAEAAQKRWWIRKIVIAQLYMDGKSAEEILAKTRSCSMTITGDDCFAFLSGAHLAK